MDWATWAASKGVDGACEAAEFLREQAPEMPQPAANPRLSKEAAAREAGLSTPLPDNAGARMMTHMAWTEGQPLGSRSNSWALLEPLRPDTSRCGGQLHGIGYVGEGD